MAFFSVSQQRAALVTGASHGIGAAVAERLAKDGLAVVINYASRSDTAQALVSKIEQAGGVATAVKADVSDPAAVKALFDAAEQAYGGIDVLVNNAGVMKLSPIAKAEDALFDQHVAVNLKGVFNCLREVGQRMRDGGRVVSFSSSVVGLYQPTYGVYAATKAGVEAMTHIFAKERCAAGRSRSTRWRRGRPIRRCLRTARARSRSTASPRRRRLRGWASLWTSPMRSPSWSGRTVLGSTGRCCASTVA